jgi:enediyne biosynthesis protein E4
MKIRLAILTLAISVSACGLFKEKKKFQLLDSERTGIDFNNRITETDSLTILGFEYLYNGAGVGVGDLNNDGLQDIFFAGNMVSSRLYLNTGDFHFNDVTKQAGLLTSAWCTGVAMVDINQDGLLDIHVSTIHPKRNKSTANLFFLNKAMDKAGIPLFEEIAAKIGLADSSYSTQAAFLDYDLDGDLDMYLLTNALESYNRNAPIGQKTDGTGKSVDKFFKNEGMGKNGLPTFKDVSHEAGIVAEGWGLGIVVNDFNNDGYPDVYVANDFLSNDHLFINTQHGSFTNQIGSYLKHQEHNGMGVDVADINNDGLNEIVVMDMMPDDNLRQKTMFASIPYDRFNLNLKQKYQTQYVRNVLQLNNGNGTFSDIGYLAGVNATDWSWSALLADYDNDGYRDLLITNGYQKDVTDLDFVTYSRESSMFGTDETRLKNASKAVGKLKPVRKPNFIFKNNGDLTFTDKALSWGLDQPSCTNGAAYSDFDNDGDLDLVMSNINEEAFVYRNQINEVESKNNCLRIQFMGAKENAAGLGTKIWIYYNGKMQYAEHQLQRGYKSNVEAIEHFGLGKITKIDSIKVIWPGGKWQVIREVSVNTQLKVNEAEAIMPKPQTLFTAQKKLFNEVHAIYKVFFKQDEIDFADYKQGQSLLPHKHSQSGPGIAVGDVNGDAREDFVIGGAAYKSATLYAQQPDYTFLATQLPTKEAEDMGLLLLDADDDNDLDLYCVSGSSEFGKKSKNYQDRFYRNVSNGKFILDTTALPLIESSGGCVAACDFDKDGDLDIFRSGRISPVRYPESPISYLLKNNGDGKFENATASIAPSLERAGMITAALWTDFDNDGWTDLMVVGEWMPIIFFKNNKGLSFTEFHPPSLAQTTGWWNSISAGDFDNDGDTDYVCGNLGLNSVYKASPTEPVSIYAKDYDGNGSLDPILCRFIQGKEYITHPRETLTDQIAPMRRVLQRYSLYGSLTFPEIFPKEKQEGALVYKSTWFASAYIENKGNGNFSCQALPIEAQLSPLFGITVTDFNEDGNLDILAVGNSYSTEVLTGFYDAGIGTVLKGNGKGNFVSVPVTTSGFFVDTDAKGFAELNLSNNKSLFIVTANQDSVQLFDRNDSPPAKKLTIEKNDSYAELTFKNGSHRKQEFYFGSSYLSQSTRTFSVTVAVDEIVIVNVKGVKRVEPKF